MSSAKGRRWLIIILLFLGSGALMAIGGAVNRWEPPHRPRQGWLMVRPPHEVPAIAVQGDIIWAGGQDGVAAIDRNGGQIVQELDPGFRLEHVQALLVDKHGTLWVGQQQGLARCDGEAWHIFSEEEGLPDTKVNALLEDNEVGLHEERSLRA